MKDKRIREEKTRSFQEEYRAPPPLPPSTKSVHVTPGLIRNCFATLTEKSVLPLKEQGRCGVELCCTSI